MNIGRNAPCPCGSGKKYKKCCLGQQDSQVGRDALDALMKEIGKEMENKQFSSTEELQEVLNKFMQQKNAAPFAAFHGLTPEQMHRLLHFPFDSPTLVHFAADFDKPPEAQVLTLFHCLPRLSEKKV